MTSYGGTHRFGFGRIADRLVRLHRCQGGQAIYAVVFFLFLLLGLLFLVLNTGEKLNHKVMMQGAADSVTTTGAGWYARGLNTISMCNVAQTQLLSMIILLDALETVTPPATECIDTLVTNIGSSKAGKDIPIDDRTSTWLAVGNAASERQIIHQFDDIVKAIQWPEYLTYDSGVLWECAKLMNGFEHAIVPVTPLAAQREAMAVAKKNHAEFGFFVPMWPELPVVDGKFGDFREPMVTGHLPPPYNDQVIGGFAWVMQYWAYGHTHYWGGGSHYDRGGVQGPWSFWREPFVNTRPMGLFDVSRFSVLFNLVSAMKLEMMFGSTDDQVSLRDWEMDYDKAKGVPQTEVRRCWWESLGFDCRYEYPKDEFFANMDLRHWRDPTVRTRAYPSMDSVNLSGYTRSKEAYEGADPRLAVWYKVTERWTAHYPELGIFAPHPPFYPDGSPWPYTQEEMQKYYHVSFRRFDGLEKNTNQEALHRNYLPPAGVTPDLAPIMFDPVEGENVVAKVNEHFTFNGFAYRPGKVREFADRFINPNPIEKLVAYGQARVYNRFSWDLFTQHWKVKLMRLDRWQDMLPMVTAAAAGAIPAAGKDVAAELTDERLKPVSDMLSAYKDDFVKEVTH